MKFLKLLFMLVVFGSSLARVEAAEPAESLFKKAKSQYALVQFDEALETLSKAEAVAKDPGLKSKILIYQGLIHGGMENGGKAVAAFIKALKASPDACNFMPKSKTLLIGFCRAERQKMRGTLVVTVTPADSEVWLDGKKIKGGGRISLLIGSHRIMVKSPDSRQQVKKVIVYADKETKENFTFDPFPTPAKQPIKKKRLWTWIALGGAGAAAVTGIALQISARSKYGEWLEGASQNTLTQDEADYINDLSAQVSREEAASWVMIGLAGAAAVGTVALYFMENRSPEKPVTKKKKSAWSATQIVPLVGRSQGVTIRVHF